MNEIIFAKNLSLGKQARSLGRAVWITSAALRESQEIQDKEPTALDTMARGR